MVLRTRLIVLTSVIGLGWLTGCGGGGANPLSTATSPSSAVPASAFVGSWQNVDPNTRHIPQLQIRVDGGTIYVHAYGACVPAYCDWGEASAPVPNTASAPFTVNWSVSFETDRMTLTASPDGTLQTTTSTHFTDGSGRADYTAVDLFKKAS